MGEGRAYGVTKEGGVRLVGVEQHPHYSSTAVNCARSAAASRAA